MQAVTDDGVRTYVCPPPPGFARFDLLISECNPVLLKTSVIPKRGASEHDRAAQVFLGSFLTSWEVFPRGRGALDE